MEKSRFNWVFLNVGLPKLKGDLENVIADRDKKDAAQRALVKAKHAEIFFIKGYVKKFETNVDAAVEGRDKAINELESCRADITKKLSIAVRQKKS